MSSLRELQEAIKDGKKPNNPDLLPIIERLRSSRSEPIISDHLYATAKIGMANNTLDPNQVMVDGINGTFTKGPDSTQLIGLALRYGADPNLYVRLRDDVSNKHVLYYIWDRMPKTRQDIQDMFPEEEYSRVEAGDILEYHMGLMEDMLAFLMLGGSDPGLPAVDTATEIAKKGNQVATIRMLEDKRQSVMFNIELDGSRDSVGSNNFTEPATRALNVLYQYGDMRNRLIDYVDVDENVHDMVILLDAEEAVTMNSPSISRCVTGHAIKCMEKSLNIRSVTYEQVERYMEEAINSYNVPAMVSLVERGSRVRYNLIDRLILSAGKNATKNPIRPLSAALQNRMMVEIARRGIGFDKLQINLISSYSPKTAAMINEIQTQPYWRRTCRVAGEVVPRDLKEFAREIGMAPSASKSAICKQLNEIDKAPEDQLQDLAVKLQTKRLKAHKTSLGDLVSGRVQKAVVSNGENSMPESICVNENLLPRDTTGKVRKPGDFSDLDMVLIESEGKTYCFTSEDYDQLLDTVTNPFDDTPLTTKTIKEIESKKKTLESSDLPLMSKGTMETIKQIKANQEADNYEIWSKNRALTFYSLALNYGIPTEYYTTILTNEQIETVAGSVTGIEETTFDIYSKQRTLRSFGNTMMELIDLAPSDDAVDGLFGDIADATLAISGDE